ncbi:MAG: tetratricopeptide repeat protein [Elusimicrobiota bacterium]
MYAAASDTGSADFSRIVADPQSSAMGDSIVYAPPSAAVMVSNPAAITSLYQAKLSLTDTLLSDGVDYRFIGIAFPTKSASFGVAVSYFSYGNNSAGIYQGTDSPKNMQAIISGALPLRHEYPVTEDYGSVGASVKMLQSSVGGNTAQSLAADVGILSRLSGSSPFTASIAVKNIGGKLTFPAQSVSLPLTAAAGIKYEKASWSDLVLTADVSRLLTDGTAGAGAGISFSPVYPVTLRGGWKQSTDNMSSGFGGGVGLDFNDFSLNYTRIPSKDLSFVNQWGIDIAFGKIVRPDIAYNHYLTYHFEIAKDKYNKKDYLAARQELEEILSLYPDHQGSKEYLVLIGQALDDFEKQRMIGISRWLTRARVAFSRNDLLQARRYYNYVLGVDPENTEAVEGLSRIEESARQLRSAQGTVGKKAELLKLWDESIAYYRNGNYVEAKEGFKKYLVLNPSNKEAQRFVDEIEVQVQKITLLQTNDLFVKGVELYDQGQYRDAVKYFNAVVMALPARTDAQWYADQCQKLIASEEKKISAAQQEQSKEKIKDKVKDQIDAAYMRAVSQYQSGDYDEALKSFTATRDTAVKYPGFEKTAMNAKNYITIINSQYAEKEYKSGVALFQDKKLESAAVAFRKALAYNMDHAAAREELARVSESLSQQFYEQGMKAYTAGNLVNAKECFNKSLYYKPDKSESLRALERMK